MDIRDAEDAVLEGSVNFETWRDAFLDTWFGPLREMMVRSLVNRLPDDVRGQLDGEALAVLEGE